MPNCKRCKEWNNGIGSQECIKRGCFEKLIPKVNEGHLRGETPVFGYSEGAFIVCPEYTT
uniref:Uncharacterized protein n=1 Tax=viral metagenome TaxID=1070528 RepID=A0A6M3JQ86_9ZZZZ